MAGPTNETCTRQLLRVHSYSPKHVRNKKDRHEVESNDIQFVLPVQLIAESTTTNPKYAMETVTNWLKLTETFTTPSVAEVTEFDEVDTNRSLCVLFACYPSRIVTTEDNRVSLEILFRNLSDLRNVWNCYRKGKLQSYAEGVSFEAGDDTGPGVECNVRIVIKHKHYYSGLSTLFAIPDALKGASTLKRTSSLRHRHSTTSAPRHQTSHPSHVMETSDDEAARRQKLRISGDVVKRLMTPVYTSPKQTWSSELKVTLSKGSQGKPISSNHSEERTLNTETGTRLLDTVEINKSGEKETSMDILNTNFDHLNHVNIDCELKSSSLSFEKDDHDVQKLLTAQIPEYCQNISKTQPGDCKIDSNVVINDTCSFKIRNEISADVATDIDRCNHIEAPSTTPVTDYTYYTDDFDLSVPTRRRRTVSLPASASPSWSLDRNKSVESLPSITMRNWNNIERNVDTTSCGTDLNNETHMCTSEESMTDFKHSNSNILVQTIKMDKNHNSTGDINQGLIKSVPLRHSAELSNIPKTLKRDSYENRQNLLQIGNMNYETRSMPDLLQPSLEKEARTEIMSKLHTAENISGSMDCNDEFPDCLNAWLNTETLHNKNDEGSFVTNISSPLCSSSMQSLEQQLETGKENNDSQSTTSSNSQADHVDCGLTDAVPNDITAADYVSAENNVSKNNVSENNVDVSGYNNVSGVNNAGFASDTCISTVNDIVVVSDDIVVDADDIVVDTHSEAGAINNRDVDDNNSDVVANDVVNVVDNVDASKQTFTCEIQKRNLLENESDAISEPSCSTTSDPALTNLSPYDIINVNNLSPNFEKHSGQNDQRNSSGSSSTDQSYTWDKEDSVINPGISNVSLSGDDEEPSVQKITHSDSFKTQKSPVRPKSLDANYIFKPSNEQTSSKSKPEPLDLSNRDNDVLNEFEILTHETSPYMIRPKSLDFDRRFSLNSNPVVSPISEETNRTITPVTPGTSEDDFNIPFRRDTNFNLDTLSPRMSLPTIRRKRANQLRKGDDNNRFSLPRNLLRISSPPADEPDEALPPPSMSVSLEELAPKNDDDSCYKIVYELVTTEQSYVSRLFLLNKIFFETIARENEKHRYFSADVLETIFSNTPQIHSLHKDHLLPELKKRIKEWEEHKKIGDIMRKYAPMFKLYSIYVCDMDDAIESLDKWTSKSSKFNSLLKNIQKRKICGRIGLKEHMLEPVQRLPRYQLLLERYLKKLPEASDDRYDTEKGLDIIKDAAQHANDFIKSREMRLRLITIGKMIDGEKIVTPTREIIKEGNVMMPGKNGPEQKRIFLFNDMLMVCTPNKKMLSGHETLKVKYKLNVERIKANDYDFDPSGSTFTVRSTTEEGEVTDDIKMQCASEEEKYEWLQELQEATKEAHERSLSFRRKLEEQKSKSTGYHPKQIFKKIQAKNGTERHGPERNGPQRHGPERHGPERNGPITHIQLTKTADETEIFV